MVAIYLLVTTVALFAISFVISGLVESFLVTQRTETQSEETMRLALELAPKLDGFQKGPPSHLLNDHYLR